MSSRHQSGGIAYASHIPYSSREQPSHHGHPLGSYAIYPDLSPVHGTGMFPAAEASWPLDAEPKVSHAMMCML